MKTLADKRLESIAAFIKENKNRNIHLDYTRDGVAHHCILSYVKTGEMQYDIGEPYGFMNDITVAENGAQQNPVELIKAVYQAPDDMAGPLDKSLLPMREDLKSRLDAIAERGYFADLEFDGEVLTVQTGPDGSLMSLKDGVPLDGEPAAFLALLGDREGQAAEQIQAMERAADTIDRTRDLTDYGRGSISLEIDDKGGRHHELLFDTRDGQTVILHDGNEISMQRAFNALKGSSLDHGDTLAKERECLAKASAEVALTKESGRSRESTFGRFSVTYVYDPDKQDVQIWAAPTIKGSQQFLEHGQYAMKEITTGELAKLIQSQDQAFANTRIREVEDLKKDLIKDDALTPAAMDVAAHITEGTQEQLLERELPNRSRDRDHDPSYDTLGDAAREFGPIYGEDAIGRHVLVKPETSLTEEIDDGYVGYDVFVDGIQVNSEQVRADKHLTEFMEDKNIDIEAINDLRKEALENPIELEYKDDKGIAHVLRMEKDENGVVQASLDGKKQPMSDLMSDKNAAKAVRQRQESLGKKLGKAALKEAKSAGRDVARTSGKVAGHIARKASGYLRESVGEIR